MGIFDFFRKNKPTPNQKAFLKALKVKEKPKNKEEASSLIQYATTHWNHRFERLFPGFDTWNGVRELTRPLQLAGRHSNLDAALKEDVESVTDEQILDLVYRTIGPEAAEILRHEIDDNVDSFSLGFAIDYIDTYRTAIKLKHRSPLYSYAAAGVLISEGLLKPLLRAGESLMYAHEDDEVISILKRKNKVNEALQRVLTDRGLRKRMKKIRG